MNRRRIARLDREVSEVGLGTWQLGAQWGDVSEDDALDTLRAAAEAGVSFFDTADVYGDGRSEQLIGRFLREHHAHDIFVATKMGRRDPEQDPSHFTAESFRAWTDRSRRNLGVDRLDLVQLHCPPDAVFDDDRVFDALDTLVAEHAIAAYGVSVETVDQGLRAVQRPHVATVQVIFNALRLKPLDVLLPTCDDAGVGVIVRVPLASGLLSGKYDERTTFAPDDHRSFNRQGEAFDVGETFAGVDFDTGLRAVERLRPLVPDGATMAQWALRWVLAHEAVSVVIPGARNAEQARANAASANLPAPSEQDMAVVRDVYDELVRPQVHHRW
jgi:aryl-alcohol dehydrogenase-like predicted oxidoreductase